MTTEFTIRRRPGRGPARGHEHRHDHRAARATAPECGTSLLSPRQLRAEVLAILG